MMMELTDEQIDFIRNDLRNQGILIQDIEESLVDHICCEIENSSGKDFYDKYYRVIEGFGVNGILDVQNQTLKLINNKINVMKKTMYAFAYLATFLCTTGILFKVQHWTGASIILTVGVILFNLGFLPLYFYGRYKKLA